jgi:hypothetical protein
MFQSVEAPFAFRARRWPLDAANAACGHSWARLCGAGLLLLLALLALH